MESRWYKSKKALEGLFTFEFYLNYPCFLEGSVRAVLLNVAHAVSADVDEEEFSQLRHKDATLGEICLATHLSGGVELSSTRPVAIPSAYLGALSCYFAFACHSLGMLAWGDLVSQIMPCN